MPPVARKLFSAIVVIALIGALAWAVTFEKLPKADFTFNNGTEPATLDPSLATGQPENRLLNALFEGLLTKRPTDEPNEQGIYGMEPMEGVAELPDISEDGKTYTFRLRPQARWSNGRQITADDFVWSWRRTLHPETASEYTYQLYYIVGAEKYNTAVVEPGDEVEVELSDRPRREQLFPRGTMVRGKLIEIVQPDETKTEKGNPKNRVYVVETEDPAEGKPRLRRFSENPPRSEAWGDVEECRHVLLDFEQVGVKAPDPQTLVVTLRSPTPFFNHLVAFYTLFPVCRECVEEHGSPNWTKPENIVTNGPYRLQYRRLRERVRLVKSPTYWNADEVAINVIDAMSVESTTTGLNMYLKGQLDWTTAVPTPMIPLLREREDYVGTPILSTYFYRLNVARPPLDNVLVRRALNMAIDKQEICDWVARAGQVPARSLVPPGLAGYETAQGDDYNVKEAQRLLAEAGFPGGQGFPRVEIVYNTLESHRAIAEVISQQWRRNLGVATELRNLEWGVYLDTTHRRQYTIARAGWVGDYPDPNTFLDMFVTDGPHNQTNWSSPEYDRLIEQAAKEPDVEQRMALLRQAEEILVEAQPIIPIYYTVSVNMVSPRVKNFFPNLEDLRPLGLLQIEAK